MTCPLDYSLCDKTVTVYRLQGDRVLRCVIENVFYQWQIRQTFDAFGQQQETAFLLILPGSDWQICPGDRVLEGIGPEISAAQWQEYIPVNVRSLAEVCYVKPCYWEGTVCHYEAGRS